MSPAHRPLIAGAAALLALAAAACGGSSPTPSPSPSPSPSPTAAGIVVEAAEFAFTPSELTIPAAGETSITLVNKGVVEHDFTVDALGVKILAPIGKSGTGTISGATAGTYEIYCSVAGHKQNGMVGTLTVE